MSEAGHDDPLFDFILYLITSARTSLDERAIYGSFRLIEGASRLIEAAEEIPGLEVDDFLRATRNSIDRNKARMMLEKDAYRTWLTDLATGLASESVKRSRGEN
ncbi:MAG: DUF6092 family protein [bacterium]|nr:DUF6092 family protein [bacterium]MDE0601927.1 DUF6092 family protein [bacterium]